jgi:hypothetical protein
MNKKVLFFLLFCFLLAVPAVFAAAGGGASAVTRGFIKEIKSGRVTITDGLLGDIVLLNAEDAYILAGGSGSRLRMADLAPGMVVSAYHSQAMTRSIPPRAKAIAVVTGSGPTAAQYFRADEVEQRLDGVRVLDRSRGQYVTIKDDVLIYPWQIAAGQELLLWYQISAMSFPAQGTAEKAVLLNHEPAEVIVRLPEGIVKAGGRIIPFAPPSASRQGELFLPLRAVSEGLGYTLLWDQERKIAALYKEQTGVLMVAGSRLYAKNDGQNIYLSSAPLVKDGKTLVPLEFFSVVLGRKTQVTD